MSKNTEKELTKASGKSSFISALKSYFRTIKKCWGKNAEEELAKANEKFKEELAGASEKFKEELAKANEKSEEELARASEKFKEELAKANEKSEEELAKANAKSEGKLAKVNEKLSLISALLSANSSNEALNRYQDILENQFLDFANSSDAIKKDAKAMLQLQEIKKELQVLATAPELLNKTTIAIGGGFSAGKSQFISYFFKGGFKLPSNINPTTAISTYVINMPKYQLVARNHKGAAARLSDISENFHSRISHDFIKSFDFNLKDIMPTMIIGTPMKYKNICFIDTPGYNPSVSDNDYANEDMQTAAEVLLSADVFIWLIGADASGTIPQSDLEFLDELELENKKLYVVYNKADLKPQDDIDIIIEEIQDSLDDYDIAYEGVSAFSALTGEELSYCKQSIFEFINSHDVDGGEEIYINILKQLHEIYSMYKSGIEGKIQDKKDINGLVKSIRLDLLEEDIEDSPIEDELSRLAELLKTEEYKESLKRLDDVIEKLKGSIDEFFDYRHNISFEEFQQEIRKEADLEINAEVKVPELPESVADATLVNWYKKIGDYINEGDNLADLETNGAVLIMPAPVSGILKEIKEEDGATVEAGTVVAIMRPADGATENRESEKTGALAKDEGISSGAKSKEQREKNKGHEFSDWLDSFCKGFNTN